MKLICTLLAAVAAATLFTGCANIQTAQKDDLSGMKLTTTDKADVAHVHADNWGLYLLWIPLLTGSTDSVGDMSWNKDTVKVSPMTKLLTAKAKELGATSIVDLRTNTSGMALPPFFIFSIQDIDVSANAVK